MKRAILTIVLMILTGLSVAAYYEFTENTTECDNFKATWLENTGNPFTVGGVVLYKGKPVPNFDVSFGGTSGSFPIVTDSQGRFSCDSDCAEIDTIGVAENLLEFGIFGIVGYIDTSNGAFIILDLKKKPAENAGE